MPAGPLVNIETPPFLRWAGGKRWLIPVLRDLVDPAEVSRYYEPFLGGGAAYLGVFAGTRATLSDLNSDLIGTYKAVKADPSAVAEVLSTFNNTAEEYYRIRADEPTCRFAKAAQFIFLNQTSFNGIWRVNLQGKYNVPYGGKKSPNIPNAEWLAGVASSLHRARILAADFEEVLLPVGEGDLVFLDPPYTVAHDNNGFIKYNERIFAFADQERLACCIERIKSVGAKYIMTNAAHQSIRDLFDLGDRRIELLRRNTVGGSGAGRNEAKEYLFTNIGQLK